MTTNTTTTIAQTHERVFDWAEHKFPEHTPNGQATTSDGSTFTRCYASGMCLQYRAGRFFIIDPSGNTADVGSPPDLLPMAERDGF